MSVLSYILNWHYLEIEIVKLSIFSQFRFGSGRSTLLKLKYPTAN